MNTTIQKLIMRPETGLVVDPSGLLPTFSLITCGEKIDNADNQISPIELVADNYDVHDNLDESKDQVEQGKVCTFFAGIISLIAFVF